MMLLTDIMMNLSNRVAIFSDLHVGVHCNSSMWHKITLDWADWFVAQLHKHKIQDVIFCGDFFHDRDAVAVNSMHIACQVLDKFKPFRLFMIPGNHDCYYKEKADVHSLAMFSGWQNICVFDKVQSIQIGNKHACMVPWGFDVKDIPQCDLMFGHFEIQTFKMNSFRVCEHGLNIKDLLQKSPMIVSGHFHFRDDRVFETGTIKYVGNPFQMDLNDSCNVKGFYIYDSTHNEFEFYKNTQSPLIYKLQLSNLVSKNVDVTQLRKLCSNNIIRFIIDKVVSTEDADYLVAKLGSLKPLQMSVDYNSAASQINVDDRKDLSGIDVEQAIHDFIAMLEIENKQEIEQYCLQLYRKFR